ncbi:gliding motility protein RemB [Pseudofulvibacter geojedonensis]|uniref:Gliding motility protein RemB n=1 Tax=Pseudofulvibacter geojedonensis TaxID=1123758 RepID=A0ABW3I240_9FLAO
MKRIALLLIVLLSFTTNAQVVNEYEKYPVFKACDSTVIKELPACFKDQVQAAFKKEFVLPEVVVQDEYIGSMNILFEVTKEGDFKLLYTKATYAELKEEVEKTFNSFPKVQPATFDGKPVYTQFSMQVLVPSLEWVGQSSENMIANQPQNKLEAAAMEYDSLVNLQKAELEQYSSGLNIPFTHQNYARFDANMNVLGNNTHTSVKPYDYNTVSKYYNFEENLKSLQKEKTTWLGKKFWNEHLLSIKGKDYWFTGDIVADLQLGKDLQSDISSTYNNTRAFSVQGGLGKKINFSATVFESQGRFADYVNAYAESIRPDGGNPAIIPGRGIAKAFKTDSYDYPLAEGYVSYRASDMFTAQFGHGKNFIGDGYRSLFTSDAASPYPYLKLNTSFWKIKYTNTWMWLKDVRPEATVDGAFATKYMATHNLSWNVTKRLNLGFFESVLWTDTNNRGFDINYLNPVIFYRAIEFSTGSRAGNALIGLSGKYKVNNNINTYGQLIIDEFSSKDIFGSNKSWKNKLGYQLGVKYYNAFKVRNLMLQAEYNQVRPYTYSHDELLLNYGHNNQSMAHLWGANFREFVGIAHYNYKRWYGMAKLIYGQRGLDTGDGVSYGGDIFVNNDLRPSDNNINILQGNKTNVFIADLQAGYLINPSTNLKAFVNITQRSFSPTDVPEGFEKNTTWVNFGFRTDIFNWYFDF